MGSIQPRFLRVLCFLILSGAVLYQPLFSFGKRDSSESNQEIDPLPGEAPLFNSSDPIAPQTGGYSEMDLSSPMVMDAIEELVIFLEKASDSDIKLEISKAESQVVAGHNIRLYYQLNGNDEKVAVVFFPLNKEEAPKVTLVDK